MQLMFLGTVTRMRFPLCFSRSFSERGEQAARDNAQSLRHAQTIINAKNHLLCFSPLSIACCPLIIKATTTATHDNNNPTTANTAAAEQSIRADPTGRDRGGAGAGDLHNAAGRVPDRGRGGVRPRGGAPPRRLVVAAVRVQRHGAGGWFRGRSRYS